MKLIFSITYWDKKNTTLELGTMEFPNELAILQWLLRNNFKSVPTKPGAKITTYSGMSGLIARTMK